MAIYRATAYYSEAVNQMAVSSAPIQRRIVDALTHVSSCSDNSISNSLPEAMLDDVAALFDRCTAVKTETGRIEATCLRMSDEEAVAVAKDIVRLNEWLNELWRKDG